MFSSCDEVCDSEPIEPSDPSENRLIVFGCLSCPNLNLNPASPLPDSEERKAADVEDTTENELSDPDEDDLTDSQQTNKLSELYSTTIPSVDSAMESWDGSGLDAGYGSQGECWINTSRRKGQGGRNATRGQRASAWEFTLTRGIWSGDANLQLSLRGSLRKHEELSDDILFCENFMNVRNLLLLQVRTVIKLWASPSTLTSGAVRSSSSAAPRLLLDTGRTTPSATEGSVKTTGTNHRGRTELSFIYLNWQLASYI